jgi:hypothetical protein
MDRGPHQRGLVEAVGRATCAVTTHDALGFFEHGRYQRAIQPL